MLVQVQHDRVNRGEQVLLVAGERLFELVDDSLTRAQRLVVVAQLDSQLLLELSGDEQKRVEVEVRLVQGVDGQVGRHLFEIAQASLCFNNKKLIYFFSLYK